MLYDGLLIFAAMMLLTFFVVFTRGGDGRAYDPVVQALWLAVSYSFLVGYWAGFGRTLGMQAWKLRIETPEGGRPGIGPCTLRYLAAILSWLPAGLGFLWVLIDPAGLSWHDRLSGTRIRHRP